MHRSLLYVSYLQLQIQQLLLQLYRYLHQTEKALEEAGDKVDSTEKAAVEADLKDLKDLVEATKDQDMTDAQVEDLKAKKDKLMTSAQNLFTKMYEAAAQAQQGAQGAADAGANQGAANDDVVDGDYKEV